jgi:SAM-dependent methyltransferase
MTPAGNIHENKTGQRQAWDTEYQVKGTLWGNSPLEPTTQINQGIFLDLGCGNGKNFRTASFATCRIGLDFSMTALRLCRSRSELADVSFICADVRYLPFKKSQIQNIDAHHILGHLLHTDRITAAREITRTLSPDGELLVTVFGTEDFRSTSGVEVEDGTLLKGNGIITHYFSESDIQSLFVDLTLLSASPCTWTMRVKNQRFPRFVWILRYRKSGHTVPGPKTGVSSGL